ncbi:hydrolase, nudix family protein [Mycobacteroides abscessus subsp. abscessus]|nr:hydrolase, nudix family protein [Mycobacteroides abscessus subsp. abscessus]
MLIARRFHNDAVRDTLALRTRRPVRWLHLGGTAPLPTYFEIAERATPAASTGLAVDTIRTSSSRSGSPSAAAWSRGRACARPRYESCGRRPATPPTRPRCAGRSGGGWRCSPSTAS